MLRPFEIHQPEEVRGASALLGQYGEDATFYAGGTELLLVMKEGLVRYRHLVDLKTIPGLNTISYDAEGWVRIGGTATHRELMHHEIVRRHVPILTNVERQVANVRVRNVGTIGGNLCFAEPHSDPATLFLVFDAEVELASQQATRAVPMREFFVGPFETVRQPDEVLTRIRLRPWGDRTHGAYMKFGIHERPTLGVALAVTLGGAHKTIEDIRIAVGCVGPKPQRAEAAEAVLRGLPLADAERRLNEAATAAADGLDAISDLHGSAEYKTEMVKVFTRRAFRDAVARFQ
jgi:aerobic carbon-monoxide dehydrogenase medium subunit